MPEGDTVWLAARRLDDALGGRVLVRTDFRVPQLATTDLTGRTISSVVSRGKHLLMRTDAGVTLHTHLRMDGSWHLYRPRSRWSGGPAWQVRVVLATDEWTAVGYRLPVVELVATAREQDVVGHLGPDILGPDWSLDEAVRRLLSRPDREMGPALIDQRNLAGSGSSITTTSERQVGFRLLDQRRVAGLGTLYRAESLFLAGVNPFSDVEDADLARVLDVARRLMLANLDHPQQSTTGNLRRGQEHWVFQREGRPCRRCGQVILHAKQGQPPHDRDVYWCPGCQPGPSPADASTVPRPVRWAAQRRG